MDFGTAPRTAPIAGLSPVSRADVVATQGSVGVELPPQKTVQSAQAGEAVKLDIRAQNRDAQARSEQNQPPRQAAGSSAPPPRPDIDQPRELETRTRIELQTGTVVQEKTDPETGETVQLVPDEMTLKLRLLARANAERSRETGETGARLFERTA